jgi:hypothetical protein
MAWPKEPSVDCVSETVSIGFQRELLAVYVDQHIFGDAVIVIGVVRSVLEMPFDLAGVSVHGKDESV